MLIYNTFASDPQMKYSTWATEDWGHAAKTIRMSGLPLLVEGFALQIESA